MSNARSRQKRCEILIRESTYERLQERARKGGEQVSTFVDSLINQWLDEDRGGN